MSQNISTTRGAPAIKKRNFAGDEPISILFLDLLLLLLLLLLGIKRQGRRYSNSIRYVAECYSSETSYKKSLADASSGLQLFRKETQNHAAIFKREWVEKEEAEKNIQKEGFLGGFPPWFLVYFDFFAQQRRPLRPHPPLACGAVCIFVPSSGPFASRRKKESSSLFDEPYLGFFSPSRTQLFVYGVTFCCNLLYEKYRMLW